MNYEAYDGEVWIQCSRIEQQDIIHNGSHDEVNERGTTHVFALAQYETLGHDAVTDFDGVH